MMRLLLIWQFCFLVTFLCFTQRHIRVVFYVTQRRKVLCFIFLVTSREFWDGSAICVTEVFRIKTIITVYSVRRQNLYKLSAGDHLIDCVFFELHLVRFNIDHD